MIPEEIYRAAWSLSARHLLRGQRDPTLMVAEAIVLERQRCLKIATECCGKDSDIVKEIRGRQSSR